MQLRFDNYRRPLDEVSLSPTVEQQIDALLSAEGLDLEAAKNEWGRVELVDVVDVASGEVVYQLYMYPGGSGCLFEKGTTQSAGYVAQHGLEVDDVDLFDALQEAFEAFDGFEETVYFD